MGLRGEHLVTLFNPRKYLAGFRIRVVARGRNLYLTSLFVWIHVLAALVVITPDSNGKSGEEVFHSRFADSDLSAQWDGDPGNFIPATDNRHLPLKLNAPPESGMSWIATREAFSGKVREWVIRQNFAPSNNNRSFFFLNAGQPDLTDENLSGLAIRTGENGNPKHFRLIPFENGRPGSSVWESDVHINPETAYRIRVLQTPDNELHFYIAEGPEGVPLLQSETYALSEHDLNQTAGETGSGHSRDRLTGHFGIRADYTATRSDQTSFGDVIISETYPEPGIAEVHVLEQAIKVTFTIPPAPEERTQTLFSINNGNAAFELECEHPQICKLRLAEPIDPGMHYLEVSSYRTIYGQTANLEKTEFIVPHTAESGDVAINEFMYDPPEDVPQYVELFNHTDKVLSLKNWRLQRRNLASETERYITANDLQMHPGEYLVLTADKAALTHTMGAENVFEMSGFPRLNRASVDKIRLFSEDNQLIDSLQYQPSSWGGRGVALERKSPVVPAWLELNWNESNAVQGGTPGTVNSVTPPDSALSLISMDYSGADRIILGFDNYLKPDAAESPDFYRLSDIHDDRSVSAEPSLTSGSEITLHLHQPMSHGAEYHLEINGVSDLFGNIIEPVIKTFHYYHTHTPEPGDVVINEILYRPGENDALRFMEIKNTSEHVFDLRGWKTGRHTGNAVTIIEEHSEKPVFLLPGQKAVISEKEMVIPYAVNIHIPLASFPSYSRLGDSPRIISPQGITIDSVGYKPDWGGNADGISLERIDPQGASSDPANWAGHPHHHTAGKKNHNRDDSPGPPEALLAEIENGSMVTIHFNRFISSGSIEHIHLHDRKLELTAPENLQLFRSKFTFSDGDDIQRMPKSVHMSGFRDYAGRKNDGQELDVSFPPVSGDLIINEIMYQPLAERYSSTHDQSEYVEIFNRKDFSILLAGLHLHDRPDKHGAVRSMKPEVNILQTLAPGSYAVFHADTSRSPGTARIFQAFDVPEDIHQHFYRVDRLTLGLSTQGDHLYLANRAGDVIDSVWYRPEWHNPDVTDTRGISLERIRYDAGSQNPDNWTSNTMLQGGTPGFENSVSAPVNQDISTGLHLEPNPFSPDGDGVNDHLVISYQLEYSDYLMHVRIFDRNGRPVRTLADGERAGYSGKLIWDGRDDSGLLCRVGLYIVHFEAASRRGGSKSYRIIAVLAVPL